MGISSTMQGRGHALSPKRSGLQFWSLWALCGILFGIAGPTAAQEQPFSHIDDDILHLTPVTRQLDYVRFLPSLGAFRSTQGHMEVFHFDNVLLPPASYTDNDPDGVTKRRLTTASDVRHSVIPQINPHGTISLLLNGNGETLLDSEQGQAGFRSNSPPLPDAANPDSDLTVSGAWTALPAGLTFSSWLWHVRRRRKDRSQF